MREIKFRFYDTTSKKIYNHHLLGEYTLEQVNRFSVTNDPYTKVMQYTGLKDNNGVEIYEGDILKAPGGQTLEVSFKPSIHSGTSGHGETSTYATINLFSCWGTYTSRDIEVIGNIHENPELVKRLTSY